MDMAAYEFVWKVSTRSRPKAAGDVEDEATEASEFQHAAARRRLAMPSIMAGCYGRFQHAAARRRLADGEAAANKGVEVSTRSRPKAAGRYNGNGKNRIVLFQHAAARRRLGTNPDNWVPRYLVSTRSRPKAAGASLKSLAPSGFAALISLGSQEKREREYNTAFSVTPAFAIS